MKCEQCGFEIDKRDIFETADGHYYHNKSSKCVLYLKAEIEQLRSDNAFKPVTNPPPVGVFVEVTDLTDIYFAYLTKNGDWFLKDYGITTKHFVGWRHIRPLPMEKKE